MKYYQVYFIALAITLNVGCNTTLKDKKSTTIKSEPPVQQENHIAEIYGKAQKVTELSQNDILDLEEHSKFEIGLLEISDNQMSFASESKLIYKLLGNDLSEDGLRKKYGKTLLIEKQNFDFDGQSQVIKKYSYNKSFFKVYHDSETNTFYLACGRISDKKISLPYNICIGQARDDFFSQVFKDSKKYDFSGIDTVYCGNHLGEIEQCYVFKQDTLSEITMKSVLDWIDFELE